MAGSVVTGTVSSALHAFFDQCPLAGISIVDWLGLVGEIVDVDRLPTIFEQFVYEFIDLFERLNILFRQSIGEILRQ